MQPFAPPGLVITVDDLRYLRENPAGTAYCVTGLKAWARSHNLCLKQMVREGIPASVLLETGDEMAAELVARVIKERGNGVA